MYRCVEILKDYDHLLKHDKPMECGKKGFNFGCFFRKYGASISSLIVFASGAVYFIKRKIEEVSLRSERKNI
jgi:hypothetical protein